MERKTTADILIERLTEWGVDTIFGLPGDGINGIIEAIRKRQKDIRFIHVRHEESAAFMAVAYAKLTGKLGVCLATTGPGGIHLLNGLYDAKMDSQPILAITGLTYHDLIGTNTQQDIELDKVFEDATVYNERVMGAKHILDMTDLACRHALAYRGPSHLTIPIDIQDQLYEQDKPSMRAKGRLPHTADAFSRQSGIASPEALQSAADLLNNGRKVAILAGQGALHAREEVLAVAEKLQAPVVKALLGKAVVPDDSPYTTGGIGLLGTKPSEDVMKNCDTLLIIGSTFPYLEYYPSPGQAKAVQIDSNPAKISRRYAVDAELVGDSRQTLRALLPLLHANRNAVFLKKAQAGVEKWQKLVEKRGTLPDMPMKPQVPVWHLGKLLADDAIITADCGINTFLAAREISLKKDQQFILSGTLASMAAGLPYAIAAQTIYPGRQVVAIIGDGGFTMQLGEFMTAVQHQLPIKLLVIKNNAIGQIKWEQMAFLGNPEFSIDLAPMDFAAFAEACGATGLKLEKPEDCQSVLEQALKTDGPVIIEATVDPHEPVYPPYIKPEMKEKFQKAMDKGEIYKDEIMRNIQSDKSRQLI